MIIAYTINTCMYLLSADEKQRQKQNFSANIISANMMNSLSSPKKNSLRDYYGKDEQVYIMDAKKTGNIGRFLNVSNTTKTTV